MPTIQVIFDNIEVHRDGDPIDRGELYWSLRVDGVSVSTRSSANPMTIDSPNTIPLGSSRTVAKALSDHLAVSGSVSEQDPGNGNDELAPFNHDYVAGNNWGVGKHSGAYVRQKSRRHSELHDQARMIENRRPTRAPILVRLSPGFCTRDTRGISPGITCTATQSINQRRVGGWPGSFWMVCG
jgi:hypothetical protein